MIYGYARVSTAGQARNGNSLEDQCNLIHEKYPGITIIEEVYSGAKTRPQFTALIETLCPGDTLVVTKLDRFCRTAKEGLEYIDMIEQRKAAIHVLNLAVFDRSPTGKLMKTMLLGFAEFERDMIRERTSAGKEIARQRPEYKEGRPTLSVTDDEFQKIFQKQKGGEITATAAAKELHISRSSWYNLCRNHGAERTV